MRGGGTTRPGALIRSADLDELTPAGLDAVRNLRPARLIDLRSGHETVSAHPLAGEPFFRSLPFVDPDRDRERRRGAERTKADLYTGSLDRNGARIADIALEVAEAPPGPVIVHCKAGADRTGMLCALFLEVAGVEPAAIIADYAATSRLDGNPSAPSADPSSLRPARQPATADTMTAVLAHLTSRYGGAVPYLRQHGVTAAHLDSIRHRLIRSDTLARRIRTPQGDGRPIRPVRHPSRF